MSSSSSKSCGVCGLAGHNVRGCNNASAGASCASLMNASTQAECLALSRAMSAKHVSFALCHGFNVPVAGGRKRLTECIVAKFNGAPVSPVHTPVHTPAPVRVQDHLMTASTASHIIALMLQHNETGQAATLLRLNGYRNERFENADIVFTGGHVQGPQTCRNAIIGVINNVLNRVLADHTTARANFGQGDDLDYNDRTNAYLNAYVHTPTLLNCIAQVSFETHVALSTQAINYTVDMVKTQNYARERRYLTRLLNTVSGIAGPNAVAVAVATPPVQKTVMRALKTVVSCRPKEKKTAEMVGCGICFDDFKPSLIAKTGCDHGFCTGCISTWAKERGIKSFIRCPCCRAEIDTITVGTKAEMKKVSAGLRGG